MTNFGGANTMLSDDAREQLFGDLATEEAPEPAVPEPAEEPEVPAAEPEAAEPEAAEPEQEAEAEAEPDPLAELQTKLEAAEKRYADARREWTEHQAPQLAEARSLISQYEQLLTERSTAPVADVAALTRLAEESGVMPEQVPFFIALAQEVAKGQTGPIIAQSQAQAQAQVEAQMATANASAVEGFRAAHEGVTDEQEMAMLRLLTDIGAIEAANGPDGAVVYQPVEPLSAEVLDIAYEAVVSPELGTVLRATPNLYETDEGIEVARRLASTLVPVPEPTETTQPVPATSTEELNASLAAAETLRGRSAARPGRPASGDEEVLFLKPSEDIFFSK